MLQACDKHPFPRRSCTRKSCCLLRPGGIVQELEPLFVVDISSIDLVCRILKGGWTLESRVGSAT